MGMSPADAAAIGPQKGSSLLRRLEAFVASREELWIRPLGTCPGQEQWALVQALKSMDKHRAILFFKHISADLDDAIGTDTEKVPVKGGVVQLAEGKSVGDGWVTSLRIRNDMSRVKQLVMAQVTDSTVLAVRSEDSLSKSALMQSLPDSRRYVVSSGLCFRIGWKVSISEMG